MILAVNISLKYILIYASVTNNNLIKLSLSQKHKGDFIFEYNYLF